MADLDPRDEQHVALTWALANDNHFRSLLSWRIAKGRGLTRPGLPEMQTAEEIFDTMLTASWPEQDGGDRG